MRRVTGLLGLSFYAHLLRPLELEPLRGVANLQVHLRSVNV